ncbi:acyl-CoA dehydrogenase domain protein [Mycobacterium xenopi 3993]|nr:acyl-CoA dehydrogenase domain protein [Mycobacterium xenopi 3993]
MEMRVDFGLTHEQEQLAESERSWLTRHDPIARIRAAGTTSRSPSIPPQWRTRPSPDCWRC